MGSSIAQAKAHAHGHRQRRPRAGRRTRNSRSSISGTRIRPRVRSAQCPEYLVRQPMTDSTAVVTARSTRCRRAAAAMPPRPTTSVFRNSYAPATVGPSVGGPGRRRSSSSSATHSRTAPGRSAQSLTGCNDTTDRSACRLSTKAEVEGMAAADRTLFMVRQPTRRSRPWRATSRSPRTTTGWRRGRQLSTNLRQQIVTLITRLVQRQRRRPAYGGRQRPVRRRPAGWIDVRPDRAHERDPRPAPRRSPRTSPSRREPRPGRTPSTSSRWPMARTSATSKCGSSSRRRRSRSACRP